MKTNLFILSAIYIEGHSILITFSNKQQRMVDFLPLLLKLSGVYSKYAELKHFKKFVIGNGNIYWGKNEDVIFPVHQLYSGKFSSIPKEEILYVL